MLTWLRGCAYPLWPMWFSVYASCILLCSRLPQSKPLATLRRIRNTRYGWLVKPYEISILGFLPSGTFTLKEATSFACRTNEFLHWLFTTKPVIIIFEACGTSNYWKQKAIEAGHDARLISAKLVATVRQNQKTDKNDALAIVQAAQLPEIRFIKGRIKRTDRSRIRRCRKWFFQ